VIFDADALTLAELLNFAVAEDETVLLAVLETEPE